MSRRLSPSLRIINDQLDRSISRVVESAAIEGHVPSCRLGCHACCYNRVDGWLTECIEMIRRLGPDVDRQQIERDAELMSRNIGSNGWLDAGRPCVALRGGLCRVYAQRPMTCRTYLVVTDPSLCGPPSGRQVGALNIRTLGDVWPRQKDLARRTMIPNVFAPLPFLLPYAVRWVDGQRNDVRQELREIGADASTYGQALNFLMTFGA